MFNPFSSRPHGDLAVLGELHGEARAGEHLLDELLHMIARKAAVKAGDSLTPDEIDSLAADAALRWAWNFAKRYRGTPTSELSFNLVNEAPNVREGYMSAEDYRRVMRKATEAIRKYTPEPLGGVQREHE